MGTEVGRTVLGQASLATLAFAPQFHEGPTPSLEISRTRPPGAETVVPTHGPSSSLPKGVRNPKRLLQFTGPQRLRGVPGSAAMLRRGAVDPVQVNRAWRSGHGGI